jgi:hypothetical protein
VDVKSILHFYPDMKQINVNCSPTVSVNFTKEGKHFLAIKVHTIILHILLIDFHFIKSKSSTLFLRYDHLNFMLETRQRSVARAYSRGLNFECPREAGKQHFDLSLSDLDAPEPPLQDCTKKTRNFYLQFSSFGQRNSPTVRWQNKANCFNNNSENSRSLHTIFSKNTQRVF